MSADRIQDACELAPANIRAIAPYQPGKPISELARELNLDPAGIIKLASNENPLGIGPRALEAAQQAVADLGRYPDGNGFDLKQALATRYGVKMSQIVLGNGSNDVLDLAARSFLTAGSEAVYSQHAFAVYPLATQAAGAIGIEAPARDFGHDPEALLRALTPRTKLMFIANPNNPTGTLIRAEDMVKLLSAVPANVVVVLDEAYNEYLPDEFQFDSTAWLKQFPNLIITRTFSKVYGLAGLRVGYALASPEIADLMNRVRHPFNVNSIALAAATAALNDKAFVRESYELNITGMQQLTIGLSRLKLEYIPSYGNFITFKVKAAATIFQSLLERGVIVRPIASYGMPEHLRVTIGLASENERFLAALQQSLTA